MRDRILGTPPSPPSEKGGLGPCSEEACPGPPLGGGHADPFEGASLSVSRQGPYIPRPTSQGRGLRAAAGCAEARVASVGGECFERHLVLLMAAYTDHAPSRRSGALQGLHAST